MPLCLLLGSVLKVKEDRYERVTRSVYRDAADNWYFHLMILIGHYHTLSFELFSSCSGSVQIDK